MFSIDAMKTILSHAKENDASSMILRLNKKSYLPVGGGICEDTDGDPTLVIDIDSAENVQKSIEDGSSVLKLITSIVSTLPENHKKILSDVIDQFQDKLSEDTPLTSAQKDAVNKELQKLLKKALED